MVPKSGKYYGRPFSTGIGVTQGYSVSLTLLNIILDVVVRVTVQEICGPQESQQNICFYADDGQIVGRDPIWLQEVLTTMVRIFERVGL